ncbi:MAG: tRNA (guanosine(37)-N1)-methyltransferase TrmD [Planctomycetota bacterium]
MRVDIITIFPRMFEGALSESILRIAQEKRKLQVVVTNLRDFTTDRHRSVDDRPYGGGPGMVMKVEPMVKAVRMIRAQMTEDPGRLLLMCPRGRVFNQAFACELAQASRLIFLAGHYEGYDERIVEILQPELVSIGDYILTGGELPALVALDAVARLLPGVLGDNESAQIVAWRKEQARRRTEQQRPDLLKRQSVFSVAKNRLGEDHGKERFDGNSAAGGNQT